jgi:hypothetical protein
MKKNTVIQMQKRTKIWVLLGIFYCFVFLSCEKDEVSETENKWIL